MIYLASASPRRHELLNQLGVEHRVLDVPAPPGEDEPQHPGEPPELYVRRTAREKAQRAVSWIHQQNLADRPVLCADTTVIFQATVLGKPATLAEAANVLRRLSGHVHEVHTAIAFACNGRISEDVCITKVTFRQIDEDEIEAYCATREPLGKAGSYAIQGKAAAFVERIEGSYTGVMGLPLFETYRLLRQAGR
jgi:septum formation protein